MEERISSLCGLCMEVVRLKRLNASSMQWRLGCPGEPGVLKECPLLLENQSPRKEIYIIDFSFSKAIMEVFLKK